MEVREITTSSVKSSATVFDKNAGSAMCGFDRCGLVNMEESYPICLRDAEASYIKPKIPHIFMVAS